MSPMSIKLVKRVAASTVGGWRRKLPMSPPFPIHRCARHFSITVPSRGQGEGDADLAYKLDEELRIEREDKSDESLLPPAPPATNGDGSGWEFEDQPGRKRIKVRRTYKNETITAVVNMDHIDLDEEEAYDPPPEPLQFKIGRFTLALPRAAKDDSEDVAQKAVKAETKQSTPTRLQIFIQKSDTSPPILSINSLLNNTPTGPLFFFTHLTPHTSPRLILSSTAEAHRQTQRLHPGPDLSGLGSHNRSLSYGERRKQIREEVGKAIPESEVQRALERWLLERGFGMDWAQWVRGLQQWKHEAEYRRWLKGVAEFIKT
ncbi:Mitochondrial acidic protein mam33 [Rhizophlyctis rosea]|nr:Mitochondrial acidic protein mam33 [Rhizophlyctis rosea]